jgi:hypothetical protein
MNEMSVKHRWNDPDRKKLKHVGKILPQYQIVYHKSHTDWTGIEPSPAWFQASD